MTYGEKKQTPFFFMCPIGPPPNPLSGFFFRRIFASADPAMSDALGALAGVGAACGNNHDGKP